MHLIIILWQRMAMPLPGRNIRTGDLSKSIREPFSPPPCLPILLEKFKRLSGGVLRVVSRFRHYLIQ